MYVLMYCLFEWKIVSKVYYVQMMLYGGIGSPEMLWFQAKLERFLDEMEGRVHAYLRG